MLYKLLQGLDRSQFDPHVISLSTKGELGSRIEALGVPITALGMHSRVPNPLAWVRLVIVLRRLEPQIVHTWMYHADLLGGLAARCAGIKGVVWGIHHSNLSRRHNKWTTLGVVKLCALLSRRVPRFIVSCSHRAQDVHVQAGYYASAMRVIGNGVDLSSFRPDPEAYARVRDELSVSTNALLVGMVARFDRQKNHSGFIQAAQLIHKKVPQVHFVLVGSGIDHSNVALVAAIEKAGLRSKVHLLGLRRDIPRLMAAFDLLVLPSHGEAFPNVVLEAMACHLPCVVTDVGDCARIVGATGRVVGEGDMPALAQQIVALCSMPIWERRQLGVKARERAERYYAIAAIVNQYQRCYFEVLRSKA